MPNSTHNFSSNAEGIRAYLQGTLPDTRIVSARVNPNYEPLLLLQTSHVMAAFAFSNGNLKQSYETLYRSFKDYYADQHGKWDALDLAFVFCVNPDAPDIERFCSNVETDVYFCRKFVVPLSPPFGEALSRLPFLPLLPLDGRSLRPASAQTFLQQCGVPAVLAKFLVVQRERSPEGIVEDCLSGTLGQVRELTSAPNLPINHIDRAIPPIRLDLVTIKGFRAYRQQQTFAIGSDVTVLYGPNGFGKTSFFDAIDFAVTGDVGRIKGLSDQRFKKVIKHLDSGSEESVVSLSLMGDDALRKVVRTVSNRKQAELDGHLADRKTILAELTGGDIPAADRIENFVSLFRATHLFSQEHQELAQDFQENCRLSEQVVSRMLAFEDYANAVNKAGKVREILRSVITKADEEVASLGQQISEEKRELERLSQVSTSRASLTSLGPEIASLKTQIRELEIPITDKEPDATVVRGWRAALEARYAESQVRSARMTELVKEVANLPRLQTDLSKLQEQLQQAEQALNAIDDRRSSAERELQTADRRLAQVKNQRAEVQSRTHLHEWIRAAKPKYEQIADEIRKATEQVASARSTLEGLREVEAKITKTFRDEENLAKQVSSQLGSKRNELARLRTLDDEALVWEKNRTRLTGVSELERNLTRTFELVHAEESKLSTQAAAIAEEENRLSRQIAEVDRNQSEARQLLSQLQRYIQDGTCPLCGQDHGSKTQLLQKVQKHMDSDAASNSRLDLAHLRQRTGELSKQNVDAKRRLNSLEAQLTSLKDERSQLTGQTVAFTESLEKLGITLGESSSTLRNQLHTLQNEIETEVKDLSTKSKELEGGLSRMREELAKTRQHVEAGMADLNMREQTFNRLQAELQQMQRDPRLTQVSLDIDPARLAEMIAVDQSEIGNLNDALEKAEAAAATNRTKVTTLRQEAAALRTQLSGLRTQITNLQKKLTEIRARLAELQVPSDATEKMLLSFVGKESKNQTHLIALRDLANTVELALDAATTAAALTRLRGNIRNLEKALRRSQEKTGQHQPWLKYFEQVSQLVSVQQDNAIANFTLDYGPRTSVIQRRLRSVYGFDEIEIQSQRSTISVRVRRHGEELRPTDYFSQSQQQTLLLGLFLTACLSQTWSGFSPVFLDDPVTHFDDLNTYAFLDLIVGLLESDIGRRQFVISTCDEKFLQLSRQKFRHLGDRAKFYHFSAIGTEGPAVKEIETR